MLFPTFRFNRYLLHINSNGYRIESNFEKKERGHGRRVKSEC